MGHYLVDLIGKGEAFLCCALDGLFDQPVDPAVAPVGDDGVHVVTVDGAQVLDAGLRLDDQPRVVALSVEFVQDVIVLF